MTSTKQCEVVLKISTDTLGREKEKEGERERELWGRHEFIHYYSTEERNKGSLSDSCSHMSWSPFFCKTQSFTIG